MVKDVAGESNDHPHHQSVFFAYDEVNGIHFWNPDERPPHRPSRREGRGACALSSSIGRTRPATSCSRKRASRSAQPSVLDGSRHHAHRRRSRDVRRHEGRRVRHPAQRHLKEAGGSGHYINAEGLGGGDVWEKTSPWVAIRGAVKDDWREGCDGRDLRAPSGLNFRPTGTRAIRPLRGQSVRPEGIRRSARAPMTLAAGQGASPLPPVGLRGECGRRRGSMDFARASKRSAADSRAGRNGPTSVRPPARQSITKNRHSRAASLASVLPICCWNCSAVFHGRPCLIWPTTAAVNPGTVWRISSVAYSHRWE